MSHNKYFIFFVLRKDGPTMIHLWQALLPVQRPQVSRFSMVPAKLTPMQLSDLDFSLPVERIAQYPLPVRSASRLLVLERATGRWQDRQFVELPELLHGDELLVTNNARVIPARLFGRRVGVHASPPSRATRREHLSA